MAAAVDFPAGMSIIDVKIHISSPTGKFTQGYIQVFAERKFGYLGSSWTMQEVSPRLRTVAGDLTVRVPHSGQYGLTGDANVLLSSPVGYKFVFQPLTSGPIQTLGYVYLPVSLGASVNLSAIADLGGWPHAATVPPTPVDPNPSVPSATYVETPAGSGIWRKV